MMPLNTRKRVVPGKNIFRREQLPQQCRDTARHGERRVGLAAGVLRPVPMETQFSILSTKLSNFLSRRMAFWANFFWTSFSANSIRSERKLSIHSFFQSLRLGSGWRKITRCFSFVYIWVILRPKRILPFIFQSLIALVLAYRVFECLINYLSLSTLPKYTMPPR